MIGVRFFRLYGGLNRVVFLLLGLPMLAGCEYLGLWPGQYAPVPVIGVEVTSTAIVLAPGEEIEVGAAPKYGQYRDRWERPYPPVPIEWTSSDPGLVEVMPRNLLRAHRPGRITLTAQGRGHRDTATVVVRISPEPMEPNFAKISVGCGVTIEGEGYCWGGALLGDGRTWTVPPNRTTGTPHPVRVRTPL